MDNQDKKDENLSFDSADIGKKEKTKYFSRVRESKTARKKSRGRHLRDFLFAGKHKYFTITLVVLIACIAALCVYEAFHKPNAQLSQEEQEVVESTEYKSQAIYQECYSIFENDGYYAGYDKYEEYISQITDNELLAEIYYDRSYTVYFLYGDDLSAQVLEDAQKAHELSPDNDKVLDWLIEIEQKYGDAEKAEEYQKENGSSGENLEGVG